LAAEFHPDQLEELTALPQTSKLDFTEEEGGEGSEEKQGRKGDGGKEGREIGREEGKERRDGRGRGPHQVFRGLVPALIVISFHQPSSSAAISLFCIVSK